MFVNFALTVDNSDYSIHNLPMVSPVNDFVVYEQPLNERMRLFMRVEELTQRFHHSLEKDTSIDTHMALSTLIEMVNLTNRIDLKRELMKELERQIANLGRLAEEPNVDQERLHEVMDRQRLFIEKIHTINGQLDQYVKNNELFNSIRKRTSIPGGTCDFDLPAYHYWLTRSQTQRHELLCQWSAPFYDIHEPIVLILDLIRNSSPPRRVSAVQGFFEQGLDTTVPWQILRVILPFDFPCYPEISAGRQRFSIRFLEPGDMLGRPQQCGNGRDLEFQLTCCAL